MQLPSTYSSLSRIPRIFSTSIFSEPENQSYFPFNDLSRSPRIFSTTIFSDPENAISLFINLPLSDPENHSYFPLNDLSRSPRMKIPSTYYIFLGSRESTPIPSHLPAYNIRLHDNKVINEKSIMNKSH